MHACDDQRFDAVPDAVLVLALPTNKSETSQSQRRTRKGRFACFSIRNDRAPFLPSNIHYVYKNNGKLVRWFLWQEQRWAHGWPPRGDEGSKVVPRLFTSHPHSYNNDLQTTLWVTHWRLCSVKSNHECQTRSLRSRFFFACVHSVGLAYILSDLRTCTQRMFARNISEVMLSFSSLPCRAFGFSSKIECRSTSGECFFVLSTKRFHIDCMFDFNKSELFCVEVTTRVQKLLQNEVSPCFWKGVAK